MTEQEAQEAAEAQAAARAEAEKRWPKPSAGDDLRKFDHQGGFVTGFVEGAVWERARHSPEWSCPVEGCTLKPLHTHAEFEPNEWSRLVAEERAHQVEVGYDAKHDSEHGLDHLLGWAEDYLRRDRRVEAGALIRAARELASRVAAAPSDTDRKLIDSLRRKARFFERPEGEGANETELLLNEAADALSRVSQPVPVEVTEERVARDLVAVRTEALREGRRSVEIKEITDDMVERAARSLWITDTTCLGIPYPRDWGEWLSDAPSYLEDARAALSAALGGGE